MPDAQNGYHEKFEVVLKYSGQNFFMLIWVVFRLTVSTTSWSEDHPFFERYLALLERHKLVKAAEADQKGLGSEYNLVGGWYPQLSLMVLRQREAKQFCN